MLFFFNILFCRLFFRSIDKFTIASCYRACLESNWNSQNSPANENEKRHKNSRVVVCAAVLFFVLWEMFSSFYAMEKAKIWALVFFLSHPAGEISRAILFSSSILYKKRINFEEIISLFIESFFFFVVKQVSWAW